MSFLYRTLAHLVGLFSLGLLVSIAQAQATYHAGTSSFTFSPNGTTYNFSNVLRTDQLNVPNGVAQLNSSGQISSGLINDISLASISGTTVASLFPQVTPTGPSVFLGGISNTLSMFDTAVSMRDVLASSKIGFYWHPFMLRAYFSQGVEPTNAVTQIAAAFNKNGSEMFEIGGWTQTSKTELMVKNTTTSPITVPPNTVFTATDGSTWYSQLGGGLEGVDPRNCIQPGSNYVYQIPAGATCPVLVMQNQIGAITIPANAFSLSPISGLSIVSSLAILSSSQTRVSGTYYGVLGNATSQAPTAADSWWTTTKMTGAFALANVDYGSSFPSVYLSDWKKGVDAIRSTSAVKVVTPTIQPSSQFFNGGAVEDFATDPFYATIRQMALYGGGISFDAPPTYVRMWGWSYFKYYETVIAWAKANNIEVIWIVSPFTLGGYGSGGSNSGYTNMLSDTQYVVEHLKADGLLPTRWAVENYEAYQTFNNCAALGTANDTTKATVTIPCSYNDDGTTNPTGSISYTYQNSLNNIALYLAEQVDTSTPPLANLSYSAPPTKIFSFPTGLGSTNVQPQRVSIGDLINGNQILTQADIGKSVPQIDFSGHVIAPNGFVGTTMGLASDPNYNSINPSSPNAYKLVNISVNASDGSESHSYLSYNSGVMTQTGNWWADAQAGGHFVNLYSSNNVNLGFGGSLNLCDSNGSCTASLAPDNQGGAIIKTTTSTVSGGYANLTAGVLNSRSSMVINSGVLVASGFPSNCNATTNSDGNTNGIAGSVQGLTVCWNHNGTGDTDFINAPGTGVGGFNWYMASKNASIQQTPSKPLMSLTSSGMAINTSLTVGSNFVLNNPSLTTGYVVLSKDAANNLNFYQFSGGTPNTQTGRALISPIGDFSGRSYISSGGESHLSLSTYADPDVGTLRDLKLGNAGLAVLGGTKTDTLNVLKTTTLATSIANGVNGLIVGAPSFTPTIVSGVYAPSTWTTYIAEWYKGNTMYAWLDASGSFNIVNTLKVGTSITTSTLINTAFTYATLATTATTGSQVYCSDCYSKLREAGDTSTGIPVYWNGSSWRDAEGIAILH